MKASIVSWDNKSTGHVDLDEQIFGIKAKPTLLNLVVRWQRARARSGCHKTKEIGDVRGSTRKPHAQKGTGRARAGSIRVPHWRGGATIFGPHPRSHAFKLPKKMVRLALMQALSDKVANDRLIIVDKAVAKEPKASAMRAKVAKLLGGSPRNLVIDAQIDENFRLSTRNIPSIDVLPVIGANVYDILQHDRLVLTVAAVEALSKRLARPAGKAGSPALKPATKSAAKSAKPAEKPTVTSAAKPATKSAAKSAKPAEKPATKSAAKPAAKPVAKGGDDAG